MTQRGLDQKKDDRAGGSAVREHVGEAEARARPMGGGETETDRR